MENLCFNQKEGYNLLAPVSYWDSDEEVILAQTGGCGPGKLGDLLVPDKLLGESIFLACQIHDWMYWLAENDEDKRLADKVFLWNMVTIVDNGEALDIPRLRLVMDYYVAVSFAGGSSIKGD